MSIKLFSPLCYKLLLLRLVLLPVVQPMAYHQPLNAMNCCQFLKRVLLFSILGSALSTDKTPVFWPYEDGTVRINSLKFQKVLDSRTKFQHIVWHKCIAKCTSTDQHQWLRIARMNFKGSIFIENFTDSNLYGLDARGILTIKKQTIHNNGTEYRIDIRKWGVESEFFKLLHFKDEQGRWLRLVTSSSLLLLLLSSSSNSHRKSLSQENVLVLVGNIARPCCETLDFIRTFSKWWLFQEVQTSVKF